MDPKTLLGLAALALLVVVLGVIEAWGETRRRMPFASFWRCLLAVVRDDSEADERAHGILEFRRQYPTRATWRNGAPRKPAA